MTGTIYIGTEGYDHDSWVGGFYDPDLPEEWRFQHYSNQLRSILLPSQLVSAATSETLEMLYEDSDDECLEVARVPSFQEFKQSLDVVQRYLEAQPGTEKHLTYVYTIDNDFGARTSTQRKLTDFWK